MKRISLFFAFIALLSFLKAENKIPSTVKEVTVYPNGAKITSVANVKLVAGTNDIIFEKMPLDLDINSLQVQIKGSPKLNAINFQVFTSQNSKLDASKSRIMHDSITLLDDLLTKINIEYGVLNQEESLILENQRKVGSYSTVSNNLTINDLKELTNWCKTRIFEIKNRNLELNFQQRKITNQRNEIAKRINKLSLVDAQTTGEIILKINSPIAQTSEIACIYIVQNAGWTPIYDLRAESIDKPLTLISKASIRNLTGLDWKNVKLKLSSALPFSNNNYPTLLPKYLDFANQSLSYQQAVPLPFTGSSQATLRGRVTDRSGETIIAGNVLLYKNGIKRAAVSTDIDGNYSINTDAGTYDIEFSYIGLATQKLKNVTLPSGQILQQNVTMMEDNSAVLGEVVVKEYKIPLIRQDNMTSGSTYSSEQISNMPMRGNGALVALTTGVSSNDGDGNVRIRGSRDGNTIYMVDGVRANRDALPPSQALPIEYLLEEEEDVFTENFEIEENQTVLNNTNAQLIDYKTQEIPATYVYQTVPKLDPSVFLLAKVIDYGKYNLLTGNANIFYQDTYIGQSLIDTKNTNDTLQLSLGRDEEITVKRLKPNDLKSQKKLFGDTKKEKIAYDITVKNNKNTPIQIEILDQIPVSRNKEITVTLDDKDGADYTEAYGKLVWKLNIPERKNKTVRFGYTVKSPIKKALN